jgi:hypothetical protein
MDDQGIPDEPNGDDDCAKIVARAARWRSP